MTERSRPAGARKAPSTPTDGQRPATADSPIGSFGDRVREARLRAGMTQDEVALRCGLNRVTISQVENGSREIGVTRAARLADALGVSLDTLLTR